MDQQKIDRLFREKLDHMEVIPSSNAWSKVEGQIRPKKTPAMYWIAASISLLIVSWIVWPKPGVEQSFTPIASEVSYPVQSDLPQVEFSLPVYKKEKQEEKVDIQKPIKRADTQFAVQKEAPKQDLVKEEIIELPEPESKTMVAEVEIEEPEIIEEPAIVEEKPAFRKVKITYIASNNAKPVEAAEKSDTTGVFKKVVAFAGKIDPGEMLADIKTAKDNLLNGGFKGKKDKNTL